MPIHLPPLSRRSFLRGAAVAAAGACAGTSPGRGEERPAARPVDPHRFALLADTHIDADPATKARDVCMATNLQTVVEQILKLDVLPARLFLDGDCALSVGRPGDYATLVKLIEPLRRAGTAVDMTLGNHDDRANFRAALVQTGDEGPLADRHVAVVKSPRADFYLLDSLNYDSGRPGRFGPEQLAWLTKELDARPNRPAIVLGHHDPNFAPPSEGKRPGLLDTADCFRLFESRRQVKAYVYGHTHAWKLSERAGIHLFNLPAVAYPSFQSAWVDLQLTDTGGTFERVGVDPSWNWGKHRYELKWRA